MKRFRNRGGADLERELRVARPQPREELVRALVARAQSGTRFHPRARGHRLALGSAVTALFLAALLPAGGLGYASGAVTRATHAVKETVVNVSTRHPNRAATAPGRVRTSGVNPAQAPTHPTAPHPDDPHATPPHHDDPHGTPPPHHDPTSGQHEYGTPICHHTHSATNPFVEIRVSDEALPAHLTHHGDIIPAPPGGCPHH